MLKTVPRTAFGAKLKQAGVEAAVQDKRIGRFVCAWIIRIANVIAIIIIIIIIAKECLSHMLRKGMRCLWDLSSLGPVLCADAKNNSDAKHSRNTP